MSHALAEWESDKTLYVFTSLTAGSSHIVTATSRIETILRANRLHFTYIDTATNESARKLYGRRGRGRKLPLLVKQGEILGDLNEVEELNEFGELKQVVGELPPPTEKSIVATPAKMAGPFSGPSSRNAATSKGVGVPSSAAAPMAAKPVAGGGATSGITAPPPTAQGKENVQTQVPMRGLAAEAAAKAQEKKKREVEAIKASLQADKEGTSTATAASNEKAAESTDDVSKQTASDGGKEAASTAGSSSAQPSEPALQHRGSSLSVASAEEIKEIERQSAIPEETEEDGEDAKKEEKEESSIPLAAPGQQKETAGEGEGADAADDTEAPIKAPETAAESKPPVDESQIASKTSDGVESAAAETPTQDTPGVVQSKAADESEPPVDGAQETSKPSDSTDAAPTESSKEISTAADKTKAMDESEPPVDEAHEEATAGDATGTLSDGEAGVTEVDASKAIDATPEATQDVPTSSAVKKEADEPDAAVSTQDQPAAQSEDATKSVED